MRYRLIVSPEARLDLASARRWLQQDGAGPKAKARLVKIAKAVRDLRVAPLRWTVGQHEGVRERVIDGYCLMYEVDTEMLNNGTARVVLLRVFGPYPDRSTL